MQGIMKKKAIVYVDGFNLYYCALKNTTHKWLDIEKLVRTYLPDEFYTLEKINYYTAKIQPTVDDPDKGLRQEKYLRALKTTPIVSITEGKFITESDGPLDVMFMSNI